MARVAFGLCRSAGAALLSLAAAGARAELPAAQAPAAHALPGALASTLASTTPAVASYTLSARLDTAALTLHGEGTLTWVNSSDVSVDELYFHLYLNAFESDQTLFNRSPFTRARSGRRTRHWGSTTLTRLAARELGGVDLLAQLEPHSPGDPLDRTDRRLPLPRAVAPGEALTIDLAWDSTLPDIVERTGYSRDFFFLGQWFPKIARLERDGRWAHFPFHPHAEFYADYGDYDVSLDVPEEMIVGASGRKLSEVVEGGRRKLRQRVDSVHDFAWTAWPAFQRREERIGDVDVHLLYPPGNERNADQTLAALRFALPHFDQRYGKYPYPDLTVVHPPEYAASAGGMEYPTLITTGGPWHQSYWSRAVELVTIHELGHQWFYGLIATDEPRWPFLDEGLNSYAESVASEAMFGQGSAGRIAGFSLSESSLHRAGMSLGPHDAPIAQAAREFVDFSELGALVYSRTALLFRTLASVYGPERLESALRAYATRFRFAHPGPEELLGCIEEQLGSAAAANARAALFDGGGVDYSVRDLRSVQLPAAAASADPAAPASGGATGGQPATPSGGAAHRFESRVVIHRHGELTFPVGVLLVTESGERIRREWDGQGRDQVFSIVADRPVTIARVDPDDAIAIDEDLLDNALRVEPPAPLDTWDRVLYAFQLAIGWLTP
jgi:peptidase M1-like protein